MGLYSILVNIVFFSIVIIGIIYLWFHNRYKYWARKGIYSPPTFFPFGNIKELVMGKLHIGQQFEKLYLEQRKKPFVGLYLAHKPIVLINDLELIKHIMVKDFMHFTDHGLVHNEHTEPLEGHLFNINGTRWKNLRVKLISSFTSGKIKLMFDTMVHCSKEMQEYLEPQVEAGNTIDLKEILSKLSTDIIGTCAFGVDCKSISSEINQYREMSLKSQRLNHYRSMVQTLSLLAPWIVTRLRTSMYEDSVNEFYMEIAKNIVKYRKENNVNSNDYMQTLLTLRDERIVHEKNGKQISCEDEDDCSMSLGDIAAQLFVFFIDGVDTSSTTSSFTLFELAKHPEVQDKIINEIDTVLKQHDGKLTYDSLADMKYLAQAVDETLRMYPPLPLLFRLCTKSYHIPDSNAIIDKGTLLIIPTLGIHRNPDVYADPMTYNPDRFSAENRAEYHRFAHIPFGEGPRICMGTRFGPVMAKLGLVSILSRYNVTIESKYVKPVTYVPHSFILAPIDGINLILKKRDKPFDIKF